MMQTAHPAGLLVEPSADHLPPQSYHQKSLLQASVQPPFFPSNARWLSPGRLSSRKDNCILQINRIKAAATSVVTTMCIQKGTELDQYTIHWLTPCGSKTATKQTKKTTQTKTRKTNNTNKPKKSTVGGQLISS
jgi:hypothetical protein